LNSVEKGSSNGLADASLKLDTPLLSLLAYSSDTTSLTTSGRVARNIMFSSAKWSPYVFCVRMSKTLRLPAGLNAMAKQQ
jgi:hypothetical protein